MPEPSLSEILNINADPERGTGEPAVVYDNKPLLQGIQRNAELRSANDMQKYLTLLQNKKDFYKAGADIAKEEVDPNDKVALQKKMADVFSQIADNPKALFGGADMDNLQGQLATISADATKSKQKYDFNKSMMNHIITSPSFNTAKNRSVINQSEQTPLDEWQPYTLSVQPTLDMDKFIKSILGDPKDPANPVYKKSSENIVTPDKQFYFNRDKENFYIDPALKRAEAALSIPDTKEVIQGYYDGTPEVKKQYEAPGGGGIKKFWRDMIVAHLGTDRDSERITDGDYKPNTNYLEKEKLGLKWAELGLKKRELDKADSGDMVAADGILRELSDSLKNGKPITEVDDNGKKKDFIEISDPNLLKQFATIDKDGKVTNTADVIRYDPETDQAYLVYFDTKRDDQFNKTGGRWIDKKIPLEGRTWANSVTQRTYGGKDKGNVNELVQNVITKVGGLYKLSQFYNGVKPAQTETKNYTIPKGFVLFTAKDGKDYFVNEKTNEVKPAE